MREQGLRGDNGTAALAVASIRRCRQAHGRRHPLAASRLLITADVDGSSRYHYRLWKAELAAFAAEIGLMEMFCHFPPGALRSGTR
ncbi:ISAzo13-like element transposase-related protein [Streptomyces collinus]|uniref:ISAzo13-like element transposase-related protein n=1 Tax=Streptomyces collinus TaxID=42684 RepID=UPI003F53ECE5